ncbi:MAG: YesL family protein [Anaerolineae bacterium]
MLLGAAFTIVWRSLKDAWEDAFQLALNNVIWLLAVALGPIAFLGVSQFIPNPILLGFTVLLTALVLPLATVGMFCVTNRSAHGKAVHVSDLFDGVKRFWWRSWIWFFVNILILGMVGYSLYWYTGLVGGYVKFLVGGFWLGVALVWMLMQIYFWPLMIEQGTPNILRAWRNSFVLVIREPLFVLILALCLVAITAISVIFAVAFMIAYMAIFSLTANNAALALLAKSGVIELPRPQLKI